MKMLECLDCKTKRIISDDINPDIVLCGACHGNMKIIKTLSHRTMAVTIISLVALIYLMVIFPK